MTTLAAVRERVRASGDAVTARFLQGFFKTGPGEYGEGDEFLGIRVPVLRRLAREFRELGLRDVSALLRSPMHEERLLALLMLVDRYERGDDRARAAVYALYLRHTRSINSWDLVDASAAGIVGAHLERRSRRPLTRLAASSLVWDRRIAIVATFHFIRLGEYDDTLRLAVALILDEHDLIHKAVGWMLREVGKRDRARLVAFLDRYGRGLPRTTLRYAIERFTPRERRRYMRR